MDKEKDIFSKVNHSDGMRVPEGYFADFAKQMEAALPDKPETAEELEAPRSTWQRIRTYVYMAAMFAGIWCMLKMFTMIATGTPQTIENNPILAEAFTDDGFVNDYLVSDLDQWDIYDEIVEDGIDPDTFCESLDNFDINY